jgi:dCMP deaminase
MLKSNSRLSKIEWWLELAKVSSLRSEDPFCKVGAVGVRNDGSIAGCSYNGAPPKINLGKIWENRDERRVFVIHAETNLLRYIKPHECPIVATTLSPCFDCLKNLSAYGVKTVYFPNFYDKCDQKLLLKMAKIYKIKLMRITPNQ